MSNLQTASGERCATCPQTLAMRVDVAKKLSDLKTEFLRTGGLNVTVDRGFIYVTNVAGQDTTQVFHACGSASCSSIQVSGMDVGALKARARDLGFSNVGNRESLPIPSRTLLRDELNC